MRVDVVGLMDDGTDPMDSVQPMDVIRHAMPDDIMDKDGLKVLDYGQERPDTLKWVLVLSEDSKAVCVEWKDKSGRWKGVNLDQFSQVLKDARGGNVPAFLLEGGGILTSGFRFLTWGFSGRASHWRGCD